jgi:YidC/Oxa1 family membrane protein insertase
MKMTTGDQQMAGPTQEGMPDMAKMMKIMIYVSPLMMFFFNSYASGLSLYYFISNTITIGIMLVIKIILSTVIRFMLKFKRIRKEPKKQGKFNVNFKKLWNKLRLKSKDKRNSNCYFKKKLPIWELFLF